MFEFDNRFILVNGNIPTAAATAHNLHKKNSTSQSNRILFELVNKIEKENRKDVDSIILVYGEVDCRIHIYYQFMKRNEKYTIEQLIDETINNYGIVMQKLKDMEIKFYICGISPAGWEKNLNNYPWYATLEVHSQIYREFNNILGKFCRKKGYKYLDIYSKTIDNNGFMKKEYAEDSVHLNNRALPFVIDMIKEYGEK